MAENTVSLKDMERQEIEGEGNNCLKCVKWNSGKGLKVLYQGGIEPAMLQAESIMRGTNDLIIIRQLCSIIDYLHSVDTAIVGFQGELGLIKDDEEEKNEAA